MRPRRRRAVRPIIDHLDDRCLLSGTTGFTPAQITAAYGLNAITFKSSAGSTVTGNGAGETIALIEMYHDPNLTSDLHTFDQEYGLPDPTLTVDNLAGTQTNNSWAIEESLDVEWAHAIAPAANILVVEAAPANSDLQAIQNLMAAVNTASGTAGVSAVLGLSLARAALLLILCVSPSPPGWPSPKTPPAPPVHHRMAGARHRAAVAGW